MPDVIQFGADGSQAFDVIGRLQGQLNGLENRLNRSSTGENFGQGFLRSETRVANSAKNMVSNLLNAGSAADVLQAALLGTEKSTHLGLGLAVGLAAGLALYEKIGDQIAKVKKAEDELHKAAAVPLGILGGFDAAGITKQIDLETEKLEAFRDAAGEGFTNNAGTNIKQSIADLLKFGPSGFSSVSDKGEEQRGQVVAEQQARLRKEAELRLAAETRIVDAQQVSLHGSEEQVALTKAQAESDNKISELRANLYKQANPVISQEVALEREKLSIITEQIQRKFQLQEAKSSTEFQAGRLDVDLARRQLHESGASAAVDRAQVDVAKAQLAVQLADRRLSIEGQTRAAIDGQTDAIDKEQIALTKLQKAEQERKKENIDQAFSAKETAIKVGTAQAEVNQTPEQRQRTSLDEQIALAGLKIQHVRDLLSLDSTDVGLQKQLTSAIGDQAIATANRAKFDKDRASQNDQELKAARSKTTEMQLEARGQSGLAAIVKAREQAEERIAKALKDQNGALAEQEKVQGKLAIRNAAEKEFFKTPEQQAEDAKQGAQKQEFDRFVKYVQDQLARGVRFDQSDRKAQIALKVIDDESALDNVQSKGGKGDFSSVASLAGLDFSSLAALAKLDFSSLAGAGAGSVV